MREAVIVSTARTPIGRAYRGAFNATPSPTLAAHALRAAVERAGIDPGEIDDCILGCSLPQGSQQTIGRMAALRAGLPVEVPGMEPSAEGTRVCPSGTGGTNWHSPAYSPLTRLMYFFSNERCDTFMADDDLEPPHRAGEGVRRCVRPQLGEGVEPFGLGEMHHPFDEIRIRDGVPASYESPR